MCPLNHVRPERGPGAPSPGLGCGEGAAWAVTASCPPPSQPPWTRCWRVVRAVSGPQGRGRGLAAPAPPARRSRPLKDEEWGPRGGAEGPRSARLASAAHVGSPASGGHHTAPRPPTELFSRTPSGGHRGGAGTSRSERRLPAVSPGQVAAWNLSHQASIFKPQRDAFSVSRSKRSLLCERPQRPRVPQPRCPPGPLDCGYLKASWSRPEKGVIGGLEMKGDGPPSAPALRGVNKTSLWSCQLWSPRGSTEPDRRRDCPPPWGELGSLPQACRALGHRVSLGK